MRFAIAAATLLAFAGAAAAQTVRKVPKDYDTIQLAEDDCDPGDTIQIAKGRYFEHVVLDVANVTIVGSGVVWDGNIAGTEGDCLFVSATGVTVKGIAFRNGATQVNADYGVTVTKCNFLDSNISGIYVDSGTGVVISGCKFQGAGGDAVNSWASNTTVSRCAIRAVSENGITGMGANFHAEGNTLTFVGQQDGIHASGSAPTVLKNKLFGAGASGIHVQGADAVVSGNTILKCGTSWGIYVSGAGPLVEKNKVTDSKGGVLAAGDGATVNGNKVTDVHGGMAGFDIGGNNLTVLGNSASLGTEDSYGFWFHSTDTAGDGDIVKNKASDFMDAGVYFEDIHNATVSAITVIRCGSYDTAGIYITGDDNDFEKLIVGDCENRGIQLYAGADGNDFTACSVKNSSGDGYYVGGPDNSFVDCTATNCGEGLDNRGIGTVVTGGKYRGDRFDITNTGGTIPAGLTTVDFVTGGTGQVSQVN